MRIAKIDLAEKSVEVEDFDDDLANGVLGGRCLGIGLMARNAANVDPLDSKAPLIISVGNLAGTGFPLGNRLTMVFRSPLTRTIAWAHTGGYAAYELASLGYSALYITGRSEKLTTLVVNDKGISFVDVDGLRGFGAIETCAAVRMVGGDARVLSIGPVGEKQFAAATVVNDMGRSSGVRHGIGAVFGSKNLKAVVIRSKARATPKIRDGVKFAQLLRRLKMKIEQSPLLNLEKGLLAVHGTAIAVEALGENDALPVKNYSETVLDNYVNVGGKALSSTVLISRLTCSICPVACRRETLGNGVRGEGPDYAQISSLGTNCMVLEHDKISYLTQACYEAGVDPIEMGNALAVYAELSEKGYVERPLKWGDYKHMAALIIAAARGEEPGATLARGAYFTAKTYGAEELAPSVKGISLQNTDPRAEHAWGFINAVESYGAAAHIWVYPTLIKSFSKFGIHTIFDDQPSLQQLALRVYEKQAEVAALDSLGVCAFSRLAFSERDYLDGLETVHGAVVSNGFLMEVGFKILALERRLNMVYGLGHVDGLPKKFVEDPLPSGKHRGEKCPVDEFLIEYRKPLKVEGLASYVTRFPKLS